MTSSIRPWQWMSFAVTALGGTILHFLYDWLGQAMWVAPFSGVNESTWEHMKLLYWPLVLITLAQGLWLKRQGVLPRNFLCAKFLGTLAGLILIPVIYYTYSGCFGKSPDWLNITIFYLCAAAVFRLEAWLFTHWQVKYRQGNSLAIAGFIILAFAFVYYTFCPPFFPLFQDPVSREYGIGL